MRLAPLVLLLACQDNGLKVYNNEPEVAITQPTSGESLKAAEAVTFVATVTDAQTPTDELTLVWAAGGSGAMEGTQTIADSVVRSRSRRWTPASR